MLIRCRRSMGPKKLDDTQPPSTQVAPAKASPPTGPTSRPDTTPPTSPTLTATTWSSCIRLGTQHASWVVRPTTHPALPIGRQGRLTLDRRAQNVHATELCQRAPAGAESAIWRA